MACLEIRRRLKRLTVHQLVAVGDGRIELFVQLPAESVSIGRTRYTGPQLVVENEDSLSRRHCEIVPDAGGHLLRDTGSSGGSYVNDDRVIAGRDHRLAAGDIIHLGAPHTSARAVYHPTTPTFAFDASERVLIDAVHAQLLGSRTVYADWLEQHGELRRAAYLRATEVLARCFPGGVTDDLARACEEAAELLDPGWRLALLHA